MEFKERIKKRRLELGLTLEDVAKIVGVSNATISRWESGAIENQRRDKVELLAKALRVTPGELMGWEADSPVNKDEAEREEFLRLYEQAPAWLRDQVRNLLEAAEAGREVRDADPKAR